MSDHNIINNLALNDDLNKQTLDFKDIKIQDLKNQKINVWNGKEFNHVEVKETNKDSELITISFSDGAILTCTKYHKFYIQSGNTPYNLKKDISTLSENLSNYNLDEDVELNPRVLNLENTKKISLKYKEAILDSNQLDVFMVKNKKYFWKEPFSIFFNNLITSPFAIQFFK